MKYKLFLALFCLSLLTFLPLFFISPWSWSFLVFILILSSFVDENGVKKTLGIMMPGSYTFGTNDAEHMEIIAGKVEVLIACGDSNWETIESGGFFEVPANCSFDIKVLEITDYCCTFIN